MDNALVTTTLYGQVIEASECKPDSYVLVVGPKLYVDYETVHANGTVQITIKRLP